jgi:uncharacterized protein (TIGR00251 family)
MPGSWYQFKENGRLLMLDLYIQPNASRTEVAGLHDGALKIKVAAPPADHQANDKLLEFLRKSFKVGKKQILLKHGEHARHKVVEIAESQIAPESFWTSQ